MDSDTDKSVPGTRSYKLGVALSGGGARGFAHAGALMAIEEAGYKPDIIAGVSAGSVAAVLYAGGIKPLEIAQLFARRTFRDFAELSLGQGGLFRIDRLERFIGRAVNYRNIEDLPIPTYLGVTDLVNGKAVYFDHGEIGPRLVASCSIPIIFKPVHIDGGTYVDGGVLRNHPAWIIRDKCEKLIGVNVSPIRRERKINSIVEVALRTYNLMAKANQYADMALCDVSVEASDLTDYTVFDLKHIKAIFVSGYIYTRNALKAAGMWKEAKDS